MGKKIWIVNHYAMPPYLAGGTRHFDLSKELVKKGFDVTIFASSFHYQKLNDFKNYKTKEYFQQEKIDGVNFVWFKTSNYKVNNWKRFVNMISFTKQFTKYVKKEKYDKPFTIIGSSVHLIAVYGAYKASKKLQSRFFMEVRDLWPQTLIDMGMSKFHPVVVVFSFLEKFLYKKAQKIITLLPKSGEYIENLGVSKSKIYWLPNGVDLSRYSLNEDINLYKKDDNFTVVYTGVIGKANRLDLAIEAAQILSDRGIDDISFKIVGEGQERNRLLELVKNKRLKNIDFVGSVPKQEISQILNNANALFFALDDSPVFKYGISSNKLFDYLASKKPIIFSCKAGNDPVKESGAGISIPPNQPDMVVEAILKIKSLSPSQLEIMAESGYKFVEENHGMSVLGEKFKEMLLD